jgi:ribosomal protein S27AE
MDIMLIEKAIYKKVNFDDYDLDKYGLGEDGYFCMEARHKAGADLWIHSGVRPIHAHSTGEGIAARPLPHLRIDITCPHCGWQSRMGKVYKDVEVGCGRCKQTFWADPFWENPTYRESNIPGYGQPLK